MKRLVCYAMTGSLIFFTGCSNEPGKTSETGGADSSGSSGNMAAAAPAENNVVGKSGLTLNAGNEVPANKSTATGTADVKYDKNSHMLTYTVSWTGLTDKPMMAHIHGTAQKGVNAGVRKDLTGVLVKETKGSFTDSVKVDGSAIKEDSLLSGFYYFNIHTPKNPGGEIRAQIEFQ